MPEIKHGSYFWVRLKTDSTTHGDWRIMKRSGSVWMMFNRARCYGDDEVEELGEEVKHVARPKGPHLRINTVVPLEAEEEVPGRLLGDMQIGDASLHIELVEVDKEDGATAENPELQDRIDGVRSFDGYGDSYQSVKLSGKNYFFVVYPFQT